MDARECGLCCGQHQRGLRQANCNATEVDEFCRHGKGPQYAALNAYLMDARKEYARSGGAQSDLYTWAAQYWAQRSGGVLRVAGPS
jgi:hypothetical protein